MEKEKKLRILKMRLEKDMSLPLRETATNLVFGEGNPNAQLYFLGEAPGRREDELGRPFVGLAGKLLDKLLASIDLERKDVYISNIVRFRPPKNRPPKPSEINAFADSVVDEISIIKPQLVIPLGRFAMEKFLPGAKISEVHGKPQDVIWHGKKMRIMPMYHPAAAFRRLKVKQELEEDFRKIPGHLNDMTKS